MLTPPTFWKVTLTLTAQSFRNVYFYANCVKVFCMCLHHCIKISTKLGLHGKGVKDGQGLGWDGMEWKANIAMKDGRLQRWKGMEDLVDGMESSLPSFHPNSIINFLTVLISIHCIFFFGILIFFCQNIRTLLLLVTNVTFASSFLLRQPTAFNHIFCIHIQWHSEGAWGHGHGPFKFKSEAQKCVIFANIFQNFSSCEGFAPASPFCF